MALFGKKRQNISGVESWNMEQIADYLNTSRKSLGENSGQFESVVDAIGNFRAVKMGTVSEQHARALVACNNQLTNACQEYIQSREGAKSGLGKDRLKVMHRLMELQKESKPVIDQLRDLRTVKEHEGMRMSDVLKPELVARAEIGPDTKTVGANSSVRYQVTHNGKKGFFTAQTYAVSSDVQTRNNIAAIQDPEVKDLLQRNSQWITNQMERIFTNNAEEDAIKEPTEDKLRTYITNLAAETENPEARRNREALAADPRALNAVVNMMKDEKKRAQAIYTGGFELNGASVTDRNIATSRMAALLGIDRIAAHSERMIVTKDGKQIEGCFMEFAEGLDLQSDETKKRFDHAVVDLNAGFNRDHSTLEVFDYICRQKDRHGGNIFYRLDQPGPDGTRRLIGLQGIDNDLAFSDKEFVGRGNLLEDLHLIDSEMAERVQRLTRADLEYAVGDLISEKEIDAMENRINDLKNHLGDMAKLKGDEWNMNRYKGKEMPQPDAPGLSREEQAYIKGVQALEESASMFAAHRSGNIRSLFKNHALDREIEPEFALEGAKDLFAEAEGRTPENKSWDTVKAEYQTQQNRRAEAARRAQREAEAAAQQPQAKEAAPKENTARGTWRAPEKMNVDQLAAEQKKERQTLGSSRTSRTFQRAAEKKAEIKTPEKAAPAPGMKR